MSETMVSGGNSSNSDEWKDFDFSSVNKTEKTQVTRQLSRSEIIKFIVIGIVAGVSIWLLRLVLESWVISPLFCRTPDTVSVCTGAGTISFTIALGVVGLIATAILTSGRAFRAVVTSLATFVSFGALWPILDKQSAIVACLFSAGFTTLLFLFFALISSIKRYLLAVILLIVLTIVFWLFVRS